MYMIYVKTFGRFAVFIDEKPMVFKNLKVKELFAYLIDNEGDFVSSKDIMVSLWPDRQADIRLKRTFRYTLRLLREAFHESGIENVIDVGYGVVKVNKDLILCDYYEFIKGNNENYPYKNDYLFNYEWAEPTRRRIKEYQDKRIAN